MQFPVARMVGFGVVCAVGASAQADVVAYDSTLPQSNGWTVLNNKLSHYEPNSRIEVAGGDENDAQAGDIVTLAGTGRQVTQFQTRFHREAVANAAMPFTATLTLYTVQNDVPDQVIWSGQMSGLFPRTGSQNENADLFYSPNVLVPDTFAFAVAIDDCPNVWYSFGPRISFVAPTVGSSPDFTLLQDSTTLSWYHNDANIFSYEAKVWTVPGPGAAGLVGLGGAAMLRRRSRGVGADKAWISRAFRKI